MSKTNSITERDNALFEAGIKLGALYHQFSGSPVNLKTVDSLEKAIAESISVQPYVKSITVSIDRAIIRSKLNSEFGYCELEGRMLDVNLTMKYENLVVNASLKFNKELDYPLMKIEEISNIQ
ncbi:dihydroneopterin aldolase family protein [uncultured Methanomethylovorans sp.]|uniref:dihydroneopterin aldolase family protein n=1 Tax=uncultured Methanomethylovorans sp. TaxID=183759 RepID=UPI002AA67BE9|nr:dihydroneopterin aldolase family protein [uncultured Methanomethylovorans sp.]